MPKIAIGGFIHETHTFLEKTTGIEDFENRGVYWGEDVIEANKEVHGYIKGFIDVLKGAGAEMVGTLAAAAGVHGYVTDEAFELYTAGIVAGVREAMPLDGVLLSLHGAMVAASYTRAEAEVVRRVRAVVGDDVPIMVTLDLHANEDHALTDVADAVFICKEYPHTDTPETGEAAARCMLKTLAGEFQPAMAIHKPGIISPSIFQWTGAPPMSDFRQRAREWEEKHPAIYYTSIAPGFGYADVPDVGATVIVVTDGDKALAEEAARDISAYMWRRREELAKKPILKTEDAVDRALQLVAGSETPVVMADGADRTGDNTKLLAEFLRKGGKNIALSSMHDPQAARDCIDAGVGAHVKVRCGGWGQASGEPLTLEGTVTNVSDGKYVLTGPMGTGGTVNCGPSATLDIGEGNRVVLTSLNHQVRDAEGFLAFGIDPMEMDILIVRSRIHFRAYFEKVAGAIIEVDAPGMGPADLTVLTYHNVPADIYPVGRHWR
ncbi:MAG: M81 family metallopeptidase [Clostridia bacterium]